MFFKDSFSVHCCFACMHVCVRELEVTNSCELPCGWWKLRPGPLEEQPTLLTPAPSPQPSFVFLKKLHNQTIHLAPIKLKVSLNSCV